MKQMLLGRVAMRRGRPLWYLLAAACLAAVPAASATTGPGYLLHPPNTKVSGSVARPWLGYYRATTIASGSNIRSSAMFIELNSDFSPPAMVGGIQVYGSDQTGHSTSWTATMYDFTPIARGGMRISLLGPGGYPVYGHLTLRPTGDGSYSGTLAIAAGSNAISFRRLSSGAPPSNAGLGGNLGGSRAGAGGWGPGLGYLGFYRMLAATGSLSPGTSAGPGIFTSIAQFAQAGEVPGAATVPHDGGMSVFARATGGGQTSQPVAILWLPSTAPLYLDALSSTGAQREAQVHSGSFDGPVVGSFSAAKVHGTQLLGTVTIGSSTVSVDLRHG
jgi:hypothetical protein